MTGDDLSALGASYGLNADTITERIESPIGEEVLTLNGVQLAQEKYKRRRLYSDANTPEKEKLKDLERSKEKIDGVEKEYAAARADKKIAVAMTGPLLPSMGEELLVPKNSYQVIRGHEDPISFDPRKIILKPDGRLDDPLPGVKQVGWYESFASPKNEGLLPLISFPVDTADNSGGARTIQQLVVWTGTGYGERGDQPPYWHLVGAPIGNIAFESGEVMISTTQTTVEVQHFSVADIVDTAYRRPTLAEAS